MKTQITSLVNGSLAANHIGTNHSERKVIAEKVIAENPEKLTIKIRGYESEITIL